MLRRPGYSVIELIIVLTLIGGASSMALPQIGRSLAQVRVQRAATVVASNLQLAHSTAARQRLPVRLSIDTAQKVMRIRNYSNPATVYAEQRFDRTAEYTVQRLVVSDTSLVIYPSGLMAKSTPGPFMFRLTSAEKTRVVRMTRAGQIRIEQ